MNVFFTSDEHYGHRNIIDYCKRPFSCVEEMEEGLVGRHNSVVRPGDLVYHVGDMFWRPLGLEGALRIMNRLNGMHFYVLGNHEEVMKWNPELQSRFIWVRERTKIRPNGGAPSGIVLDHFAGRVWDGSTHGSWQLYGHTHNVLEEEPYLLSCDVGVDAWDYTPVSLEQLNTKMADKMYAFWERKRKFES